jgi:hypothetical protein
VSFSLTDIFDDEFEYKGEILSLDLAFDNVLRLFEMFKDQTFEPWEKVVIGLEILMTKQSFKSVRSLPLSEKHTLFLFVMKEFLDVDLENPTVEQLERVHDFEKDAGAIYASFLQAYNLDLFEQHGNLHWKKFVQLFTYLPSDTSMQGIIKIRKAKIPAPTKHNIEERKELQRLKRLYSLDKLDISSEEARQAQIKRNEDNFNRLAQMFK